MQTLTKEQQTSLVRYINDEFGSNLDFNEFADKMLGAFEDVPGFEILSPSKASRHVRELWRIYHA